MERISRETISTVPWVPRNIMADGKSDRGGTEPLAALVSVAALCIAVSMYMGMVSVENSSSDESVPSDRATLDSVWDELQTDGIIDINTRTLDGQLGPNTLPRGSYVRVSVVRVGTDGSLSTLEEMTFSPAAKPIDSESTPHGNSSTVTRPVPIRLGPGDVRSGRLTVEVWDA